MTNARLVDTGFSEILADAIQLNILARGVMFDSLNDHTTFSLENLYAKSSILSCALMLECGANALLDNCNVSSHMKDGIDRQSPLVKYELVYLYVSDAEKRIAMRSDNRCAKVEDIFKYRNTLVHRKRTTLEAFKHSDVTSIDGFQQKLKSLNIPKLSMFSCYETSEVVLSAAIDFLNWYVLDLLKWTPQEASKCLLSVFDNGTEPHIGENYARLIEGHGNATFLFIPPKK